MLHVDAGEVGTYEYPGPDTPQEVNGVMVAPVFSSDGITKIDQTAVVPTATGSAGGMNTGTGSTPAPTASAAAGSMPGMVESTPQGGQNAVIRSLTKH